MPAPLLLSFNSRAVRRRRRSSLQHWYLSCRPHLMRAQANFLDFGPLPLPPMRQSTYKRFVCFSFKTLRKRARGNLSPRARAFSFRFRIVRTGVYHPRSDDSRAFPSRARFCSKTGTGDQIKRSSGRRNGQEPIPKFNAVPVGWE